MALKNKIMKQLAVAGLALVTGLSSGLATAQDTVGFVYVSPIGDAGWTYQHDLGRLQLEKRNRRDNQIRRECCGRCRCRTCYS